MISALKAFLGQTCFCLAGVGKYLPAYTNKEHHGKLYIVSPFILIRKVWDKFLLFVGEMVISTIQMLMQLLLWGFIK